MPEQRLEKFSTPEAEGSADSAAAALEHISETPRSPEPAAPVSTGQDTTPQQPVALSVADPELHHIETILAEGLDSFFLGLSPEKQLAFKIEGEKTARKIRQALTQKTTRIKDIVQLIIQWLRSLPGINYFFLEQEAKIKADQILGTRR